MDRLLESKMMGLSTGAPEWKPGGGGGAAKAKTTKATTTSTATAAVSLLSSSDLNPIKVKEFVPGRGWSALEGGGTSNETTTTTNSSFQQELVHVDQQLDVSVDNNDGVDEGLVPIVPGAGSSTIAANPAVPATGRSNRHNQNNNNHHHHQHGRQQQQQYRGGGGGGGGGLHGLGVTDAQWRYHRDLAVEMCRQMDPTDPRHQAVPPPYCNAYCLESPEKTGRSSLGYPCSTFLVTNREDGRLYCLKRFDSVRSVSAKIAAAVSDQWQAVPPHPGTTPLYACHVFAQRAVCFVHEYVPGARTLLELQQQVALHNNGQTTLWPEPTLWSCVAQLVSAVRAVHAAHRAVRTLRLRHVLATPMSSHSGDNDDDNDEDMSNHNNTTTRWRLRLGSLGIVDALEFESRKNILDLQMEDIRDLGRLILSLASGTDLTSTGTGGGGGASSSANGNATVDRFAPFLAQHYSRDLHNLTMTLIKSTPHPPTITDISRAMSGHCFEEQAAAYTALDRAERALAVEYNSGRAMRLLLKLGYVNERPEFGHNRRWAQSGDCYILSLFRDYVFHQADAAGNPVMDLGHVVSALNKLDAADEEKIVLTSRDGKTLMIVSYADVAQCLESAFHELCAGAVPPSTAMQYYE